MNPPPTGLFEAYPWTCRPIGPVESLGNAGGFSGARLWRFRSSLGALVVRLWPVDAPFRGQLEQIHRWLAEVSSLGFAASPLAASDGKTLVEFSGRFWELTRWLEGEADLARPPALAHLRAMFAGLAAFHARLGAHRVDGSSPGLQSRVAEIERLLLGEFDSLGSIIDRNPTDPASALARTWLERVRKPAEDLRGKLVRASGPSLPLQPCLRDARPDHFLFLGDRLTGLVDFGAMGFETVAADLARLLSETIGPDRQARTEALQAYESIRPLSGGEARLIEVFERANALLGPARWVRWHFVESKAFDQPDAVLRGLRRGLERLDESGL